MQIYDKNRVLDIQSVVSRGDKGTKSSRSGRVFVTPPVPLKNLTQTKLDGSLVKRKRKNVHEVKASPKLPVEKQLTITPFLVKTKRISFICGNTRKGATARNTKLHGSTLDTWLTPLACEREFFGSSCPSKFAGRTGKVMKKRCDVIFHKKTGRRRPLYKRGTLNSL